jgi:hypothetical protein
MTPTQVFTELMNDPQIKRAVLVQFGFGDVNKSKVNKWVKEQFPIQFADIKKNIPSSKVVKFESNETETTTRQERDAFLENVMGKLDAQQERKVVAVDEEDLKNYINQKELLELEREDLTTLIFDFINEQGLSSKFYNFLEKRKDNVQCLDIEFMMLDYLDEN